MNTDHAARLASSLSVSAAETFTQALTGRPRTSRGPATTPGAGVFSDVMTRQISPDFPVGLPNERFLAPDGGSVDGPGIPADLRVPVFTPDEPAGLKDSALSTAGAVLAGEGR
ncbi:hypothetical protein ACWCXH_23345 [Kitasatospora sp. NPDC001660]